MRIPLVPALVAAMALICSSAFAQTVKVGVINTYTGPLAAAGDQMERGIELYVKLHQKDLPPGVSIELVKRDDTGPNPEVAKRLAQELITRDKVQLLTGVVWTPNALSIAPLLTEAKVPLIILNAGTAVITTKSPYIARVSFTLWQSSYPLGSWAAKNGLKNVYTLVSDYGPGIDAETAFTKAFTDGGGTVSGSVRMPVTTPDFVPFLQRAKDAKPDAVFCFVPAAKAATAFMKAFEDLGLRAAGIKLIGPGDITTDEELPNMGDVPLGVVSAGVYSDAATRPENKAFLAAWKREYGTSAIANYNSVFGWDGMTAIFDVINRTKGKFTSDQAMTILKGWKGAKSPRGPISIDPDTRDIVQNVYIRRVEKQPDGTLANIEFETVPNVKDLWKEFNPPK
jgi:branched-chain amino acid transport system substrate-binding protein